MGRASSCLAIVVAAGAAASCSRSDLAPVPVQGKLVVALTIDWEGSQLSDEGLDALDRVHKVFGAAPITHFVSAAYLTKTKPDPDAVATITEAVHPGDELAVHLHGWKSLAAAAGIEPRSSPSFLSGTDKLFEFDDGDAGFDLDLDAYSVAELRALLRTSRALLAKTHLTVSRSFRTGGYLGTPKMLQAVRDEGLVVDSSEVDPRQLQTEMAEYVLPQRVAALWPHAEPSSQPYYIATPGPPLLELPIAAVTDYATADQIAGILEAAHAQLQRAPTRDVFVVLAFHLETGPDYAGRLAEAFAKVQAKVPLADELLFTTVEQAGELAADDVARPAGG